MSWPIAGLLLLAAALVSWKLSGQEGKKQVYLLLGQSNMAGRGKLSGHQYKTHPRVLMLNREKQWVPAAHPLHFDKPKSAGVGPGLAFAVAMAEAYPEDTIFLVPCAVGGTSIARWEPGAYDEATDTHPYDDAVLRIKQARKKAPVTGALWLQGESDSRERAAATYVNKLSTLVRRIRKESGNKHLPFVVGELGRYRDKYQLINRELQKVPAAIRFTALVTSENLTHKGDSTHFDSPSAEAYGQRFAAGMLRLLESKQ
ncbi:sialate O-acetylesterase [Pedobacter sp. SYSU D00535]|uniref:sialate O-acetylesterase n=1 Tax=Pedobacter sp. SYSU D00535 TaxID=2810308 RepID=UPI001A95B836|nr:sialate O-acetylesterase [Pedobacter sp. SYSU D00535]